MATATLTDTESFIEAQFPVSKVSKESYKERKANHSQTLTGLGKWWGRKPLVMIRAALIGLLMPPSDDPKRDREIFLKIMTMDEDGLWKRMREADGNIRYKDAFELLTEEERERFFDLDEVEGGKAIHHCIDADGRDEKKEMKREIQRLAFSRLSYDEKLSYTDRPEQIDGPSDEAWEEINDHLDTDAGSLTELVEELGERQFGRTPRVGDAFCGGGSVPFEAARLGCEAYGADLNPVAALLTWASLNIVGGGEEVAERVREAQEEVYAAVDEQITEWGIEHNDEGWRADAYLYCLETECPECGVDVPMAPSWVIGKRTNTVAKLELGEENKRFDIRIEEGVSKDEIEAADDAGTVDNDRLQCPACGRATPIKMIRGDQRGENGTTNALRKWTNEDVAPRPDDTFQERLYCVRWVETYLDEDGTEKTRRHYRTVTDADRRREQKVQRLLEDRFDVWQEKGYIPSRRIEPGNKTDEPMRTRGWTHWHHLFNPRQLLLLGTFLKAADELGYRSENRKPESVGVMLSVAKCCDYDARLSRWHPHGANEKSEQVFSNQALNTLFNYGLRTTQSLSTSFFLDWAAEEITASSVLEAADARSVSSENDVWLTDPPYADAINYHELGEFFLAWYEKPLQQLFPEWYTDSKRALAITGEEEEFRRDMVTSYRNLTEHMPDDGAQIVMFTHQDASVWADLALILWAAGLRVTAAWTVSTETDSALKKGNYVQGTVLLVLRKRTSDDTAFTDHIKVQVEDEVKAQLDAMQALDEDEEEPSFGDTDYQLAAYAAALRVLTQYGSVEEWDIERELSRSRSNGEQSPIEGIIEEAVQVAADHLIPQGFDSFQWKTLSPSERLYLKGLELESHGEYRTGAYQELARGFGVREYKHLYASSRANKTRFKSASEFGSKQLGGDGFEGSHVRHALFAVHEAREQDDAQAGRLWLRNELPDYWGNRKKLIEILRYLASMETVAEHWEEDAKAARLVAGAVENDHA
jgi:adenine-specific DNA methylase